MSGEKCMGPLDCGMTWHFMCSIILPKVYVIWIVMSLLHYQGSDRWHGRWCQGAPFSLPLIRVYQREITGQEQIKSTALSPKWAEHSTGSLEVGRVRSALLISSSPEFAGSMSPVLTGVCTCPQGRTVPPA